MEEIRHYEAQNKVENSVPDTVLTGKNPCCVKHGIRLTAGVGGKALCASWESGYLHRVRQPAGQRHRT